MKEYGLIGFPLTHSFSQKFFTEKFKREGIDAEYTNFELEDIGQIMELLAEYEQLQGFNVTIPYKEQILPYLDGKSLEVDKIGAANVVKIERHGGADIRFIGYNTDYRAFKDSLTGFCPEQHEALILGTGGASKAIEYALNELGFKTIKASRTPNDQQISYADLSDCINRFSIIVNTTPLGTYPNTEEAPDIPYDLLTPQHLCYDLVYNPSVTTFMRKCAEKGATVKNGLEMLILQALYSWDIWN